MAPPSVRGIVAVGASAGGLDALQRLVAALPTDLPVAVAIVLHIPATSRSMLAEIMGRHTAAIVHTAADGDELRAGSMYVAPPDRHLIVRPGRLALDSGPKENSVRPAIDPLFRSAAEVYGGAVAAVVLSGALGDGASGAAFVAAAGGPVFAQDPVDAMVPSMPEATLRGVPGARALTPEAIAAAIAEFARALPEPEEREPWSRSGADTEPAQRSRRIPEGPASGFTCTECHGPLWELHEHDQVLYRCRVGHVFHEHSLVGAKDREVESALWSAVEALEERADLMSRVAARMSTSGRDERSASYRERGAAAARWADVLREMLLTRTPDARGVAG